MTAMTETTPKLTIPDDLLQYIEETSENHQSSIERMHENDFATHELTEESPGVWLCKRPGTIIYSFRVAFLPGAILVWGDIGTMVLHPGANRGIGWLRSAVRDGKAKDFGYLFEKVPRDHRRMEFMPGDVLEACREAYEEGEYGEEIILAVELWATHLDYEDQRESWYNSAYLAPLDFEWYSGHEDYCAEMYWCAYALCWFVKRWVKENESVPELCDACQEPMPNCACTAHGKNQRRILRP